MPSHLHALHASLKNISYLGGKSELLSASMREQKRPMDRKSALLIRYSPVYGERASNVTLTSHHKSIEQKIHSSQMHAGQPMCDEAFDICDSCLLNSSQHTCLTLSEP